MTLLSQKITFVIQNLIYDSRYKMVGVILMLLHLLLSNLFQKFTFHLVIIIS